MDNGLLLDIKNLTPGVSVHSGCHERRHVVVKVFGGTVPANLR